MIKQPVQAWKVFLDRASTAEVLVYWSAALTGHRMQGASLADVKQWLTTNRLNQSQINGTDSGILYQHLLAVLDRLPSEVDIATLREPNKVKYINETWSVSANLTRSAMLDADQNEAYQWALSKMAKYPEQQQAFLLPMFTWIAWQASEGKDENLDQVRHVTLRADFNYLLAKSMLLALEKNTDESLRFFKAARYAQSGLGLGNDALLQRPIPASYQYALSGYLMYKKTGIEAYRDETLYFVHAYQSVFPQYAWLYSMEALLTRDQKTKNTAVCRAKFLDPNSYFLKLEEKDVKKTLKCPEKIW